MKLFLYIHRYLHITVLHIKGFMYIDGDKSGMNSIDTRR